MLYDLYSVVIALPIILYVFSFVASLCVFNMYLVGGLDVVFMITYVFITTIMDIYLENKVYRIVIIIYDG